MPTAQCCDGAVRVCSVLRRSCCVGTVQRCPADFTQVLVPARFAFSGEVRPSAPAGRPWTREDHIAKSCRDAVRGRHRRSRPPAACKAFFNRLLPQQALFLTYAVRRGKMFGERTQQLLYAASSTFTIPSRWPCMGGRVGRKEGGPGALRLRPSTFCVPSPATAPCSNGALHIVTI